MVASNCRQAAVYGAGIMAFDGRRAAALRFDGLPLVRLGLFIADQLEIDETWDTVGMRGTGSHDVVASGIELPRERTCTMFDPMWLD